MLKLTEVDETTKWLFILLEYAKLSESTKTMANMPIIWLLMLVDLIEQCPNDPQRTTFYKVTCLQIVHRFVINRPVCSLIFDQTIHNFI